MKVRVPHYYDTFVCTGSKCPDTCCVGWMIEIDDESYERFMKMDNEFGERIRANIIEREDGRFFALNENGRCAFLNEDNLCEMVIKLGENSLCSLCDNYPRVGVEYGNLREMGLSLSCPEVSKLVLSSAKPIRFGEWYQKEECNGVDYSADPLFETLSDARDVLFGILQNRELTISDRASLYVMYAAAIQNVLDLEATPDVMIDEMEIIIERFSDEEYLNKALNAIVGADFDETAAYSRRIFEIVAGLEIINDKWCGIFSVAKKMLETCDVAQYQKLHYDFAEYYKDSEYVFEHLIVYYVYRYFLKMIFDGDVFSKAVMSVVAAVVIRELDVAIWQQNGGNLSLEDQINIFYLYSKEIEHCEENMAKLADVIWEEDIFQPKSVIDNMANIL